jgi:putative redox protein
LDRIPPGQHLVEHFSVLTAGPTPRVETADWKFTLKIGPRPIKVWNWSEFNALPKTKMTRDICRVTSWLKLNTAWAASDTVFMTVSTQWKESSMTSQENTPEVREVVVASDPTSHSGLVGHVGASEFPVGGPDGVGQMSPGPNPYDLLCASLAACTAMTVRFQAKRRKFPLQRVEVGVSFHHGAEGERDSFERTLVLEGELDAQQRAFLLEAANRCPVGEILGISADIHTFSDATISSRKAPRQASYEDDLAELPIPYIDAD